MKHYIPSHNPMQSHYGAASGQRTAAFDWHLPTAWAPSR